MKKKLIPVIALIMIMVLSGCQKDNSGMSSPTEAIAPTAAATPTATESPTKDPSPTATTAPTEIPTPTEIILPENAGDFGDSSMGFYWDDSSERHNIIVYIFPVNDKKAVIQLSSLDAPEDDEISAETDSSLTFELLNKAMYRNDESGITLFIDKDNKVAVTAENEAYSQFVGNFSPLDSTGYVTDATILEFLRNVPESGIGDFGKTGNKDEVEESILDDWFHELKLFRDGNLYATYAATDDMTALCRLNGDKWELVYGSMATTLEMTNTFDVEGGDENGDEYYYFEQPIVYPYIQNGSYLYVGTSDTVVVNAAVDLTESIRVTSNDEDIVIVEGTEITAAGIGETTLDVELVYGGCACQFTIDVMVIEEDTEVTDEVTEATDEVTEYRDQDFIELIDTVTYQYTMSIYNDDGFYSVDIMSTVSPDTYRHWSYFGEEDPSDQSIIKLVGSCILETYDEDGNCSEVIEFEGMEATVTRNSDGSYLWNDFYANEGEMSIFR
ncbi:MAG: hypothetical protein K6E85_16860 [Lachnospiraceae bacterium]|nr:hypothetical protein [Lachnospiraceae bacterium]